MSEFWKRKMRTYFKTCDFDRDGYVSENDFAEMGRGFAEASNASDEGKERLIQVFINLWRKFMKAGDPDKDGRLTASIFVESMKQQMYDPGLIIDFNYMVRSLHGLVDVNKDGYIQPDEYKLWFQLVGVTEGTFDERAAFAAIDANGDGKISVEELIEGFFDFLFSQDESSPNKFYFGPLLD